MDSLTGALFPRESHLLSGSSWPTLLSCELTQAAAAGACRRRGATLHDGSRRHIPLCRAAMGALASREHQLAPRSVPGATSALEPQQDNNANSTPLPTDSREGGELPPSHLHHQQPPQQRPQESERQQQQQQPHSAPVQQQQQSNAPGAKRSASDAPRAKPKRAKMCRLSHLIDAGLVSPGRDVLSHCYKGTTFFADLLPGRDLADIARHVMG